MKAFSKAVRNVKRTVKHKKAEQFLFELHVHSIDSLPEWLQNEPLKVTWIRGKKLQFTRNSESEGDSSVWDQKLSMMGKIYTGGKDKDEKKKFESKTCQLKVSKVLPPRKGGKSELPIGVLAIDLSSFVDLDGLGPKVETLNLHVRLTTGGRLAVAILNVTLKSTWMSSVDSDCSSDASSVGFMSEEESDDELRAAPNVAAYQASDVLSDDVSKQLNLADPFGVSESLAEEDEDVMSNGNRKSLKTRNANSVFSGFSELGSSGKLGLSEELGASVENRPHTANGALENGNGLPSRPPHPEPFSETSFGPDMSRKQSEEDANRMATQVVQLEKKLAQSQEESKTLSERLEAVTEELNLALQYHHEVEGDRNQAQAELKSAQNHIAALTQRTEQLAKALEESNKRIQQLMKQLQDAQAGQATVESAAGNEVVALQGAVDQLRAQLEEANKALVASQSEKHNLNTELARLHRNSHSASQSSSELMKEVESLKESLAAERRRVAELESGMGSTQASQAKRSSNDGNSKSGDKKSLLADIDSLKLELHQANSSRESIGKKYSDLQKTVTSLEVRYQQAKTECVQAKVKLGESEFARNKLEIDLNNAKSALEQKPAKKGFFG